MHACSGRNLNLSVVYSIDSVAIDKLVGNKQNSVLSESVLNVLLYIEIIRSSAVCSKQVSIITVPLTSRSVVTKFYCILLHAC